MLIHVAMLMWWRAAWKGRRFATRHISGWFGTWTSACKGAGKLLPIVAKKRAPYVCESICTFEQHSRDPFLKQIAYHPTNVKQSRRIVESVEWDLSYRKKDLRWFNPAIALDLTDTYEYTARMASRSCATKTINSDILSTKNYNILIDILCTYVCMHNTI